MRNDPDRYCRAVIEWLADLHQLSAPADDWFERIAERPVRYLEQHLPADAQPLLAQLRDMLLPLQEARLPFVTEHGDLSHPNLILMKSGNIGVVDWELSDVNGMVGYDLFFFLSYVAFSLSNANQTGDYLTAFQAAFFGREAWAARYIQWYLDRIDIQPELLAPLFVLSWTRYLSNLLMRLRVDDGVPLDNATLAQLRANNYYAMWRFAVLNLQDFVFSSPVAAS
jgi:thiamine kinase-like enzyme